MPTNEQPLKGEWALILGASSGFGEAVALELAGLGMNIFGVHLDRKSTLPNAQRIVGDIKAFGSEAVFWNVNAADAEKRKEVVEAIQDQFKSSTGKTVRVLLHSLAFGTLKPFITKSSPDAVNKSQVDMTLDVMANSLVYWTQDPVSYTHLTLPTKA